MGDETIRRDLRKSAVLIVALWLATIAAGAWDAWTLQDEPALLDFVYPFNLVVVALPMAFFPLVAACWPKDRGFGTTAPARWIDARLGAGTCDDFLRRLRPLLLLSVAGFVSGLLVVVRVTGRDVPPSHAYIAAFRFSAAAGLGMAEYIVSRRGVSFL